MPKFVSLKPLLVEYLKDKHASNYMLNVFVCQQEQCTCTKTTAKTVPNPGNFEFLIRSGYTSSVKQLLDAVMFDARYVFSFRDRKTWTICVIGSHVYSLEELSNFYADPCIMVSIHEQEELRLLGVRDMLELGEL